MRIIVVFIILILISAGLYTAYGIVSFEPEKPAPLVFEEPNPESLRSLGIIPQDSKTAVQLSPEQQDQAQAAVDKISEALTVYKQYEDESTLRVKDTLSILTGAMGSGRLPAYFLTVKDTLHPERTFEMLKLNPANSLETTATQKTLNCTNASSVMIGNDQDDVLGCSSTDTTFDRVFIGGPGNDTITDTFGNKIINPGSGNDMISLGAGRNIIVLEPSWGKDKVMVDCKGAVVADDEVPKDFPVPWVSKFTNFIVLSPRISKDSVKWKGNTLTNSESGDTLLVNENCFTLVTQ